MAGQHTWREHVSALRYILPLIRLVWQTHRGFTAATIVLRLVRAFVPLATLWVGKLIIDSIVTMLDTGPDLARLWPIVGLEIAIVLAGEVLARASALVESLLGDLFSNHTSVRMMEHAATLDLYHFENPEFYDQLERARRQTTARIGLLTQLITIGQDAITLVSLGAALFIYGPWLLALLVIAVLPSFFGETRFASLQYSLLYQWTPERRLLDYLRYIGASDVTAKEVQMFGLSPWIIERFRRLSERFYDENKRLSIKKAFVSASLSLIGTAGYYGAYVIILADAARGGISVGTLTFLAASFARSRDLIQRLLMVASEIYMQSLYIKDLFDFFETRPSISSPEGAPPVPDPVREGFVFEDVGFRYPESDKWAVRHVSFRLRPGERIAFVGENGAGKTTLTKLLARLYDPTEGRILLDDRDLREYDLRSLRRAIGVIFQDYVRYALRFDENIGVGQVDKVSDYLDSTERDEAQAKAGAKKGAGKKPVEDKTGDASEPRSTPPPPITSAAEKSLASSLLPRLTRGYRQMLGRRFEGGVDLSGGEWQKVALARAYMRDAQLLILDEPTASLDARAEYEVFKRFSALAEGRMAVIISHRFSTVRMADRIIVLYDGRIVEDGTHEGLVAQKGLYAELFTLQAEGYR